MGSIEGGQGGFRRLTSEVVAERAVAPDEVLGGAGFLAFELDPEQPDGARAGGHDEPISFGFKDQARRPLPFDRTGLVDDQTDGTVGALPRSSRQRARAAWPGRGCGFRGSIASSRSVRPLC